MKFISSKVVVLFVGLLSVSNAYRILCVFPMMTKSHFIVLESVAKILAKRGHQVDVVSHFPRKNPIENYNDIVSFEGLMQTIVNNLTIQTASQLTGSIVSVMIENYGNRICDFMGDEKFQRLLKNPPSDPPYDLVLTQAYAANCYFGLGYVLKVPVVAVASMLEWPWISSFTSGAENLAVYPHLLHPVRKKKMSFWDRLENVYTYQRMLHKFHASTEEYQTKAMIKYLSPNIPNIREVEKNVSLLLVNTHPVMNGVKPVTSAVVQIAGLHIEANEEVLSPKLKQWMDESTGGVVYFTLGSMILIETLPSEQLEGIYASFKKISPLRVLMKIGNSTKLPAGLPDNVRTMTWIPQQPVLAHPNTKVFITHGGLGSSLEALYFGIPMIGIPVFTDQFSNVNSLVDKGMSIRIDLDEISERSMDAALDALLNDPEYRKMAVYYSKLFRDNPSSQSDKAVFWIEYVIRNGGDSLKSSAVQYSWYQLLLLDIYGFVTLIIIAIISVIAVSVRLLVKKLTKNAGCSKNMRTKKNE